MKLERGDTLSRRHGCLGETGGQSYVGGSGETGGQSVGGSGESLEDSLWEEIWYSLEASLQEVQDSGESGGQSSGGSGESGGHLLLI